MATQEEIDAARERLDEKRQTLIDLQADRDRVIQEHNRQTELDALLAEEARVDAQIEEGIRATMAVVEAANAEATPAPELTQNVEVGSPVGAAPDAVEPPLPNQTPPEAVPSVPADAAATSVAASTSRTARGNSRTAGTTGTQE